MEELRQMVPKKERGSVTPSILWIADQAGDVVVVERLCVTVVTSAAEGLEVLRSENFDAVLVNWPLADWPSAGNVLEELQQEQAETPVVFYAPGISSTESIGLSRMGAFHVLQTGD